MSFAKPHVALSEPQVASMKRFVASIERSVASWKPQVARLEPPVPRHESEVACESGSASRLVFTDQRFPLRERRMPYADEVSRRSIVPRV